jgi:hypothetical protein
MLPAFYQFFILNYTHPANKSRYNIGSGLWAQCSYDFVSHSLMSGSSSDPVHYTNTKMNTRQTKGEKTQDIEGTKKSLGNKVNKTSDEDAEERGWRMRLIFVSSCIRCP